MLFRSTVEENIGVSGGKSGDGEGGGESVGLVDDPGSVSEGGQMSGKDKGKLEHTEKAINQEATKENADANPIDPGEKSESVEDEVVVVTHEEITPAKQGTNQKGGGKNKNKRGGSHSGGGNQRGGKRR